MELPKNKTALVAGVAVAATVTTAALALAVWPALTRPDPPAEADGDDGLRIRLVEPPKALIARASPLDVGLSEAAQAMAKGREALFIRTPPVRPAPPAPARRAPAPVVQVDEEEDLASPPEPTDDRWECDRVENRYELAQQRWEDERQARRERDRRLAWEQDQRDRRRWEEARERERYDDRYAPPPPPDEDYAPPPRRW